MLGRSVGIAAISALGANAFIIPAGIAPVSDAPDLSATVVNPKNQVITVPCAECAFSTRPERVEDVDDEDFVWIQGGANSLVLNFTVSENGERLRLNGEDIYPPQFMQRGQFGSAPIFVKQVASNADLAEVNTGDVRSADLEVTAYGLKEAEHQKLSPNGDELVPIRFEIMGLDNEFMTLDETEIKLLKTGDGELLIMQVENIPNTDTFRMPPPPPEDMDFPPPPPPGMDDMAPEDLDHPPPPPYLPFGDRPHGPPHHFKPTKDCNMLPQPLCNLKNALDSKIDAAMGPGGSRKPGSGCRGRKGQPVKLPGHIKPHFERPSEEDGPRNHHGRPHHMRPHGPHHDRHRHHGHFFRHHFFRAFTKGLVAVLIPVMAGITVGMSVSLLGLIVGRLIGFLWIRLVRGGRRGSASVAHEEAVFEEGEDKPMLAEMEAPEALPAYEDAPAYEEIGEKEQK